jgi:DNA-directed RNA polymerase specialized sigma24 family protein
MGDADFDEFVRRHERRIWQALVPLVGPEAAADAVADALAGLWPAWDRVGAMANPAGYVYTVARRNALRTSPSGLLPVADRSALPEIEPSLVPALAALSAMQRQVVYLVEGFGWGLTDVARMLDVSVSTVRNHRARALVRLRELMKVDADA